MIWATHYLIHRVYAQFWVKPLASSLNHTLMLKSQWRRVEEDAKFPYLPWRCKIARRKPLDATLQAAP